MTSQNYLSETWYDPRLSLRESPIHGKGLFATEMIRAGEVVMFWGGDVYTRDDLRADKVPHHTSYSFITEDLLIAAPGDGLDYFVNHSCDPSVWMQDNVTVIARRDIQPGEEITGDYVVWESEPTYVVEPCNCGSPQCRHKFTGNDWMLPELQERYKGHFLPYITERIARLPK